MHIPENYLSPATCAVMGAAALPVIAYSANKIKKQIPKQKLSLLGIFSAFSFVIMMFNIPLPAGTTGHAVGGTLIAILLGPECACISMSVALLVQALLFGDGGILAFGANCFNLAIVLPYVGYAVYSIVSKLLKSSKGKYVGAFLGSYVGINAAALCTAIELGLQPLLFKTAEGQAMYCPYPLQVCIPSMMAGHLTILGGAEVVFTIAMMRFFEKSSADLLHSESPSKKSSIAVGVLLGIITCAVPVGLIASGDAWGEWSVSDIKEKIGYTPIGMKSGFLTSFKALCPDYSIGNMPDWIGYILSGIIGISLIIIIFKLFIPNKKTKVDYD